MRQAVILDDLLRGFLPLSPARTYPLLGLAGRGGGGRGPDGGRSVRPGGAQDRPEGEVVRDVLRVARREPQRVEVARVDRVELHAEEAARRAAAGDRRREAVLAHQRLEPV